MSTTPYNTEIYSLINERIDREREKIIGHALKSPRLNTIGGQSVWVVDILIFSDQELLTRVPMAESGRSVRDFINEGTPVELSRSRAGQYYVVGLADKQRGNITAKTYSITDAGLGFTEGWRRDAGGSLESGNGNAVSPGTPSTTEYSYTTQLIPYGSLDYGTTPYGDVEVIRTP